MKFINKDDFEVCGVKIFIEVKFENVINWVIVKVNFC